MHIQNNQVWFNLDDTPLRSQAIPDGFNLVIGFLQCFGKDGCQIFIVFYDECQFTHYVCSPYTVYARIV
jgi:hypothetical protein